MFTDMPSWVPFDCAPLVDQEFEPPLDNKLSNNTNSYKSNQLENRSPFKNESGELKLPKSYSETLRTEKTTYRVSISNTTSSRNEKLMSKMAQHFEKFQNVVRLNTTHPRQSLVKFSASVKRVETLHPQPLIANHLPKLAATPKALPNPMQAAQQHEKSSLFAQQTSTKNERNLSDKKNTPLKSNQHQEQKTELLIKRDLSDHFIFPINIRSDEKEEQKGRGAWYSAKRISKMNKNTACSFTSKPHTYSYKKNDERPILVPPKIGIFALYYVLSKLGIISDAISYSETKHDIQENQEGLDALHKARLIQLKKAMESENKTKRWGIATQMFSWMSSFTAIIAGAAMIMSGVGAVAGAMIMVSGLFSLTNHIMMVTGGWDKLCDRLPGDDPKKKKAIISWMQIGITVLCLILAIGGAYYGGFSAAGEASAHASTLISGVLMFAGGIASVGQGITGSQYRNRLAESLKHKRNIEHRKHRQDDLYEKAEVGVERMKQLFKELTKALDFEAELFRADQMALGR